jgi:hypothetical protein
MTISYVFPFCWKEAWRWTQGALTLYEEALPPSCLCPYQELGSLCQETCLYSLIIVFIRSVLDKRVTQEEDGETSFVLQHRRFVQQSC